MTERRFTDEEVAQILREASEAQEGSRPGGSDGGLTLVQLREIAAEVGLDPKEIEAAASRLAPYRAPFAVPILGTPVAPRFERDLSGELSREDFADLLDTIRTVLGRRGITAVELDALEWRAADVMGGRYVSVVPRNGKTRVRVFGNFRDGAALVFLGGGILATSLSIAALAALGLKDLLGVGLLPAAMLLSLLPTRAFWRWRYGKEAKVLADLTDLLEKQAGELLSKKPDAPTPPPDGQV
jgi:hypothetical protein